MAVTKSTDLTNSAVTNYRKEYMLVAASRKEVFGQFVDWQDPISDEAGFGKTLDWPLYGELDPIETPLTEDADVTPTSITDANMTLSPVELGRAIGKTQLASFQSRTNVQQVHGKMVSLDRINSVDRYIRRTVTGFGNDYPTQRYYVDGSTTMASLTAADVPTWDWLNELVVYAKSLGMEPFEDGKFMAVVHPLFTLELMKFNEYRVTAMFQNQEMLKYGYKAGEMAGINFIESHQARIHMSAGTATLTDTTLNGAVAAGATSVIVTTDNGLAVGDYMTVGTAETESLTAAQMVATKPETVLVTGVGSTPTINIRGVGNKPGNFGLRFDHASLEEVTVAPFCASIPILGKNSIKGAFAVRTGRYGEPGIKEGLDIMDRIVYFRWYWYGGLARVDNYCVLGRCALSKKVVGYN